MEIKQGSSVAIKRLSPNGVVIGYDIGEVQEIEQVNDQARYRVARDGVELGRVFEKDLDLSVMALLGCIPEENPVGTANDENSVNNEEISTPGVDPSQDPISPAVEFNNGESNDQEIPNTTVANDEPGASDDMVANPGDVNSDPSEPNADTPVDPEAPVDPSVNTDQVEA